MMGEAVMALFKDMSRHYFNPPTTCTVYICSKLSSFNKKLTVLSKHTKFSSLRMVYNTPKHVGEI
jgi:hypothetical protein